MEDAMAREATELGRRRINTGHSHGENVGRLGNGKEAQYRVGIVRLLDLRRMTHR
jgi:hypothetical protein